MRGFLFSSVAMGLVVLSLVFASVAVKSVLMIKPERSFFDVRMKVAEAFVKKEVQGTGVSSGQGDMCLPVVTVSPETDPIESLAQPEVVYVCGG